MKVVHNLQKKKNQKEPIVRLLVLKRQNRYL